MEGIIMPRECSVTGKKGMSGNNKSHSLHTTKRRWKANLQKVKVVDENGNVSYVTEGVFRAIHRKITDKPFYNHPAPQHSYLREDAMPLRPGFPEKITFDLWPTSYQFKKGHKIRVSIAGADKDHFRNMTEDTPTYVFHHSFEKNSKLLLPIVR